MGGAIGWCFVPVVVAGAGAFAVVASLPCTDEAVAVVLEVDVPLAALLEPRLDMPVSAGGAACSRSHCLRLAMSVGSCALEEGEEAESEAFLAKPAATSTKAAAASFSFIATSASL